MKQRRNGPKKQRGLTAIELAVALMVSLLVLAIAVKYGPKLMATNKSATEVSAVSQLISNIQATKTVSGYGASGTDLIAGLVNANGIPAGMTINGTSVTNSFGGAVTAKSTGIGFTVTSAALTSEACVALATNLGGNDTLTTKIGSGTAISGEVTFAAASSGCSGSSNSITWTSST